MPPKSFFSEWLTIPLIFGNNDVFAVLIASLLISVENLAAIKDGFFLSVICSASSMVLGKSSKTDLSNCKLFKSLGNSSNTYSNSCLAAERTPSN